MSRHVLLVNRASGGNQRGMDATEICRNTETIFRQAGHQIESSVVQPGDIERALKEALHRDPDAIIVGGGDGTVSTAARLLGGKRTALGILPMGTFNLAARDLGVPLDTSKAAEFLAAAGTFPIDVLDVSGHACLCTTILGFYPDFADLFEKRDHGGHWWKKTYKLLTHLPRVFSEARPLHLTWESDGGNGTARTKFSAFVPGKYRDNAGLVPARTDFQSGTLTAYIGTHRRSASALKGVLDYALGRHEQNQELQLVKARSMVLHASHRTRVNVMLDGEILPMKFPIRLEILAARLNVLTTAEKLAEP